MRTWPHWAQIATNNLRSWTDYLVLIHCSEVCVSSPWRMNSRNRNSFFNRFKASISHVVARKRVETSRIIWRLLSFTPYSSSEPLPLIWINCRQTKILHTTWSPSVLLCPNILWSTESCTVSHDTLVLWIAQNKVVSQRHLLNVPHLNLIFIFQISFDMSEVINQYLSMYCRPLLGSEICFFGLNFSLSLPANLIRSS